MAATSKKQQQESSSSSQQQQAAEESAELNLFVEEMVDQMVRLLVLTSSKQKPMHDGW